MIQILYILLLVELLVIPFIFKMNAIRFLIIPDLETKWHLTFQVISHDAIIYFFIFIFMYISYLKKIPYIFSLILRTLSISIFLIYIIDILILKLFVTHINIADINKYISYAPKYLEQEFGFNILYFLGFIIVSFLILIFIIKDLRLTKLNHYIVSVLLLGLLVTNSFSENKYVHSWVYQNYLEYNLALLSEAKDYSLNTKNNLKIDEKTNCIDSEEKNKNIVILMVESLASYQSEYFSGIKNWTPNIDRIANENINIKKFYSNGFITEDAEISILTGLFPIYSPLLKHGLGSTAFQGFYNIEDSLPSILNKKGYYTEFITSSDLEFSNTGKWAQSLGFDYVEGSEYPYYLGKDRFHFNAVADEVLLNRVIDRIKEHNGKKHFTFIKTVSSHIPFLNPETRNYSEEETIRYVDKHIGKFYNKLKEMDFFSNGLLVIVGDHHPIIPLKEEQVKKYGTNVAGLKVPMIVSFGEKVKKDISSSFQQTDIYNSLKNFVSTKQCTSLWKGDFLDEEIKQPDYLVYRRGDRRGVVTVLNENKVYNVKLDGDNTKVINHDKSITTKTIVDKINFERIARQKNEL